MAPPRKQFLSLFIGLSAILVGLFVFIYRSSTDTNSADIRSDSFQHIPDQSIDPPERETNPSSELDGTVDPKLDEAWEDLPEIPMEDVPEAEEVEGAVVTQGGRAVPALVQRRDAAATLDLPTIELPDALWQAGLLNGHPAHLEDEILPGEYGPDRPGK